MNCNICGDNVDDTLTYDADDLIIRDDTFINDSDNLVVCYLCHSEKYF